jgi:hypothetical protein
MIATASARIRAKWPISGTMLGLSAVEGVRTGDADPDQRLPLRRGSSAAETIQPLFVRYSGAGSSTARYTGGWAFYKLRMQEWDGLRLSALQAAPSL